MRDDSLLILIAGAGGFKGSGFFGPSPLKEHRDQFSVKFPDVPILLLDWNDLQSIASKIAGKKVLGVGHSFGGQRLLHQCFHADNAGATSIDAILIDPVRYTKSDTVDPTDKVESNGVIQKLNRDPFPIAPNIRACTCFLRMGGQKPLSYPESSPIAAHGAGFENVEVKVEGLLDFARHADICTSKEVLDAFWMAATKVFGKPTSVKKKRR